MQTRAARNAWDVAASAGAWVRVAVSISLPGGATASDLVVTGLDWSAALAMAAALDPDADPAETADLLKAIETGALAGLKLKRAQGE